MIRKIFKKLGTRAKGAVNAVKAKLKALARYLMPAIPVRKIPVLIVTSGAWNALNAGKRYRLTSGHAPFFSLFTFFGDRQ